MKFIIALLVILGVLLFRLARVYTSIPLYAYYWRRQAAKQCGEKDYRMAVIGDSVAQGIGAPYISQSYMRRIVRATEKQLRRKVHISNFSVTGAVVDDAIKRQLPLLKALPAAPDLIILEIGANDIKSFEPAKFEAEFKRLLAQLPRETLVAEVPPFGGAKAIRVLAANKIVHKLAYERGNTVVPLHSAIMSDLSILNSGGDFFHPGCRGHRVWFNGFWPVILKRLS